MAKIPAGKYSHMGEHKQGKEPSLTTGKFAHGGSKLGGGSGKLKSMMVWKDTGKKGGY